MSRVIVVALGSVLCSISVLAGEFLMNEEIAYGLRVTFSKPVTITHFGDVLMTVSPQGQATEFIFSGAELPAWVGHGLAWEPTTARIASCEWLTQHQVTAIGVVRVPPTTVQTFPAVLTSSSGETIDATITRTMSQEQVPFVVEYGINSADETLALTWTRLTPWQQVEGTEARFVQLSNAEPIVFLLEAKTPSGPTYRWEEELDFLLHNLTEITLDATRFVSEADIAAVTWTAENGDPDDARTFPIADASEVITTLTSEWPNVLTLNCTITRRDGATINQQSDALVYFRAGTPFEIRGTFAALYDSLTPAQLTKLLDEMLPKLESLGVNALHHQERWWYGYPDANGSFTIHPLYDSGSGGKDPRGWTAHPELLAAYLAAAEAIGFHMSIQLRQWQYVNDPGLAAAYHQSGYGTEYGFRNTDGFQYGDGTGYQNMLLQYLPWS